MEIADLRTFGTQLSDWAADYLTNVRNRPVRAATRPGEIASQIPDTPPDAGDGFEAIFRDFEAIVMPGMTHWQHPRFFAYFTGNSSPPSVLAEWLTAALSAQCFLWQTSPAATELETRMMNWLRQMIGLPETFAGVIQDSASSATLAALLHARERALNGRGNTLGLAGQPVCRVYCSDQVHSSVDKACWIAGIGQQNLIKLNTVGPHRGLDPTALEAAILADQNDGFVPAAVVAVIGATGTGSCDDVNAVCEIAQRHGLYVHVDAAWAGTAMICPELQYLIAGSERADSFVFNPHKWMFTNFDCSAHFVRDAEGLVRTLGIRPTYLQTQGRDGIINYSEWSVPLGRRFRALKLWFVIRSYGVAKMQNMIREQIRWTNEIAERLGSQPDFEITSDPVLTLFSFRYTPPECPDLDNLNARLLDAINDDGRIYLTQTRHCGNYVIRFLVGQTYTTEADVRFAFDVITQIARGLSG